MTQLELAATAGSAVLTGVTTFVMQQAAPIDTLPLLTPLLSAGVGGGVAYGIMKATIHSLQIEMRDLKQHVGRVHDVAHKTSNRVARIEGKLTMHPIDEHE